MVRGKARWIIKVSRLRPLGTMNLYIWWQNLTQKNNNMVLHPFLHPCLISLCIEKNKKLLAAMKEVKILVKRLDIVSIQFHLLTLLIKMGCKCELKLSAWIHFGNVTCVKCGHLLNKHQSLFYFLLFVISKGTLRFPVQVSKLSSVCNSDNEKKKSEQLYVKDQTVHDDCNKSPTPSTSTKDKLSSAKVGEHNW